jgi:hypothetical protein
MRYRKCIWLEIGIVSFSKEIDRGIIGLVKGTHP